jgi:predicted RNase H-like nuclease (RuvC/YqgF family)
LKRDIIKVIHQKDEALHKAAKSEDVMSLKEQLRVKDNHIVKMDAKLAEQRFKVRQLEKSLTEFKKTDRTQKDSTADAKHRLETKISNLEKSLSESSSHESDLKRQVTSL